MGGNLFEKQGRDDEMTNSTPFRTTIDEPSFCVE